MWGAVLRRAGFAWSRVLFTGRREAVLLSRKQEPQWVTQFATCLNGKESAIGSLLGVGREVEAEKQLLTSQVPAVSFNKADQESLLMRTPDQPENARILKIAIIGAPNAGKSTLSNQLLGRKLFPVSCKVHTTRCQAQGIITDGDVQMVLLDTPGMITAVKAKRHNLEKSLQQDPWESVKLADIVLVLVDVSEKWMRSSLHTEVHKCLSQNTAIPSILVLNKVDLLKDKNSLLEVIETLTEGVVKGKKARVKSALKIAQKKSNPEDASTLKKNELSGKQDNHNEESEDSRLPDQPSPILFKDPKKTVWPHFQEVFMLSAVNGDEVETLRKYLMSLAKPGEWLFHSDVVTTQSPQEICDNVIREKLLEYLPQEIPYGITQVTGLWEEGSSGELVITQTLMVTKQNHVKIVIGAGGQLIGRIAEEAGRDLMNAFFCDVRLRLVVKFKK